MHNPASVQENDTHKLLWDFDIQMDHLISPRRPDFILINKKKKERTWKTVDFAVPTDHRIKLKEGEKKDKYLDFAWELKKTMEHEGDYNTNRDWYFWHSPQRIIKGTGGLGNKMTSGDHSIYDIIENGQNTEECPGDLRRLAVAQILVKEHQLKLMWKLSGTK